MSDWHTSAERDWTFGPEVIVGHGGGIGDYRASYVVNRACGSMLNGRVAADISLPDSTASGAGLICRADESWTFLAFYCAPSAAPGADGETVSTLHIGVFEEGVLTPIAVRPEPVRIPRRYSHFSLEFYSGRVRGEIHTHSDVYEVTAQCPRIPLPGGVGLLKLYGAVCLAKNLSVSETALPSVGSVAPDSVASDFAFDVFLCHSSKDAATVREIAAELTARGVRCWIDADQIGYGQGITEKISEGLENSRFVVVCVSNSLLDSGWSRAEYGAILNAEFSGDSTRLAIPLILDGSDPKSIPMLLRDKRRASYLNKMEFEEFIGFLVHR